MKNISIQYQDLKEGKMNRHQFLRNARMMFPSHVTQFNSFEDSVQILKQKGLLNEGDAVQGTPDKAPTYDYPTQPGKYMKVVQEPEVDEQDGIYPATTVTDIPKEEVSKPIKSKTRPDGLEPIKDKDTKNEMKKVKKDKSLKEASYPLAFKDTDAQDMIGDTVFFKDLDGTERQGVIIDVSGYANGQHLFIVKYKVDGQTKKLQVPYNKMWTGADSLTTFKGFKGIDEKTALKETIKNLVRKALAEYEVGDEDDMAPNEATAVSRIVDAFIDHANEINIRKDLSTKADVERAFAKFEDEVGKRYSDDVFDNVMDVLKNKGYKIK